MGRRKNEREKWKKKEIKDKELMEIENERYEARTKLEEARLQAIRTAELVAKEREQKRQQVLSSLQKFDQLQIQRPTYHHLNSSCEKVSSQKESGQPFSESKLSGG